MTQIDHLEQSFISYSQNQYKNSQNLIRKLNFDLEEISRSYTDSEENNSLLNRTNETLKEQCQSMHEDMNRILSNKVVNGEELERYKRISELFESDRNAAIHKIKQLEDELNYIHINQAEQSKEGNITIMKLRETIAALNNQNLIEKQENTKLKIEYEKKRDENIQLQRTVERLIRQVQDETSAREELVNHNRELVTENNGLNSR